MPAQSGKIDQLLDIATNSDIAKYSWNNPKERQWYPQKFPVKKGKMPPYKDGIF
jgi:hypothetical protein